MATVTGQFPSPEVPPGLAVLEAVLERITYANEDTGYTIARVATQRAGPDLLTVVGPLLGAQVGESLRLTGRYAQVVPRNSGMWPTVGPPASGKSGEIWEL
jgi:exodeoxyribonuclease V alpha subunit